uniref:U4/U6.U5 small nuclear ribonucleoprotein 27 kDa protein n=1 Tax=Anas platyrhynchos TaxID=8839 RepID=A0A8B9ZFT6_ANAPL
PPPGPCWRRNQSVRAPFPDGAGGDTERGGQRKPREVRAEVKARRAAPWAAAAPVRLRGATAGARGPLRGRGRGGGGRGRGPGTGTGGGAGLGPHTGDGPGRRRRHRSSSSSPPRLKERRDEEKKEIKDSKGKERQITEEDLQGKTEEEIEMMKMMGFASFDTTKGKKVDGAANAYAINVSQKRKYRQYMNRKGGFNRPLDFIA